MRAVAKPFQSIDPLSPPAVPKGFHSRLRARFHKTLIGYPHPDPSQFEQSISLFRGIPTVPRNHEDVNYIPDQEGTFWYLFGLELSDAYAIISNETGKTVVYVDIGDEEYKLWMKVESAAELKSRLDVDEVRNLKFLEEDLESMSPSCIYVFSGVNSDSKLLPLEPEEKYLKHGRKINRELLWPLISNLRAIKTEEQITLLRYVCELASHAHIKVMKSARPGLTQIQLHALFRFEHTVHCGCDQMAFNSICASGEDCATLHYESNDKIITEGQMCLFDMGGKWYGYCADQAITFPISGKFTARQRQIYQAVHEAQKTVESAMKPGVEWEAMHRLAETIILRHLVQLKIVKDLPIEELQTNDIGAIFFPHGLGHFFGLLVHDLGGYTYGPQRATRPGVNRLRTRRALLAGMCITVEPGCYFIGFALEKARMNPSQEKYVDWALAEEYRKEVGGIRLEDDVVVTENGIQILGFLPREIEDVERILAEGRAEQAARKTHA